jgi:ParB-like chromosome segregation protein Spo0J
LIETRKTKVKNEIILKALSEQSDLDALRREKRAIQLEEKRLRALLDLEKTNGHRKQDLLAAQRAERHRKQQEVEYRRKQKQNELQETQQRTTRMLKEKLAVPDAAPTTFTSFDSRS